MVIDDTLIPRQSGKAPGSIIRHDHVRKHNRPQFLLAQCWATLGVSVLELWMQIRSTAWTLVQLLSLVAEEAFPIDVVAQWLRMEFTGLAFRDSLNPKSSIFTFPEQRGDPGLRV